MKGDLKEIFDQSARERGDLISIILPVFNEAENIENVLTELYSYLSSAQSQYRFEITFIDDCSRDNSFAVIEKFSLQAPPNVRVSVIRLAKNSGSHVAVTAGLNLSRGEFTVIMASDGQDPAEVIGELIRHWKAGKDMVLAGRETNLNKNRMGNLFSRMAWGIMEWSTQIHVPENGCDFLGIDKKVLDAFNSMNERNTTFIFRLLSLGFEKVEITYVKRARFAGKSSWTFWKKLAIIADAITGFSRRPLKVITNIGLFIFFVLAFRWLYIIVKIYVFKVPPTQLTIILNTIFTTLALQMLMLGFIGDYIWRILDETRKRPEYEINKVGGNLF